MSDHDRHDMTLTTDGDRQGMTTAASASSSKQCTVDDFVMNGQETTAAATASSSKQCTVDDVVMNGQQAEIEDVESDRETKTDPSSRVQESFTWSLKPEDKDCYRELTPEENAW